MTRPRYARRVAAVLAVALAAVPVGACREDTVRLTFRPEVGATYRYEIRVRTETEVHLAGTEPEITTEDAVLVADHTVLHAGSRGVRVRVVLSAGAEAERTFVVRFDRSAQLEGVERVEGLASGPAGQLGLSEIFPTAAGAPPDRRLAPGERWEIDDEIALPGSPTPARLTGRGRLAELGVVDGVEVATVRSVSRLRLEATTDTVQGRMRLDGLQVTEHEAVHDLGDGAVRQARSTTTGSYGIDLTPPPGQPGDPIPGSLVVRVRSETNRVADGPG
jgi:hypothetical protein